jgi:catechol 2,3-dioxygenase-like lactoylglutathione lyase family enzyme
MSRKPEIKGIHAIVLIVKDLEKQKKFYHEVLGLKILSESDEYVFFECGEQKIALFTREHHPQGTQRLEGASKGISHLEFVIPEEEKEYWDQRLKEAGFHAYRDNYEDADGNLFHFVFL